MSRTFLSIILLSTICTGTSSLVPSTSTTGRPSPVERMRKRQLNGPFGRGRSTELKVSSSAMVPSMKQNWFGRTKIADNLLHEKNAKGDEASDSVEKKQSMAISSFNLVKANLGSGVLALPAGIAAFGDVPSA